MGASKAEMCGSAPAPALAPVDTTVLSRYCACKDQPHSQRGLGMLRIALVGHAFPPLRPGGRSGLQGPSQSAPTCDAACGACSSGAPSEFSPRGRLCSRRHAGAVTVTVTVTSHRHGHKSRSQVSVTVTVTVTSQRPLRMSDNAIRRLSRSQMRRAAAVAPVDTTAPSRYRRRRRSARAPARCGARPPRPPARSCPCGVSHGRARSELDTGPDPHQIRVTHLLLRTSFSSPGPLPSVCTSHGLAPVGGQDCVGGIGALAHTILTLCDEDCFCGV